MQIFKVSCNLQDLPTNTRWCASQKQMQESALRLWFDASKICPHRMSSSKASWSPTSSTITTGAKTFTTDLRRWFNPTEDSVSFNFSTSFNGWDADGSQAPHLPCQINPCSRRIGNCLPLHATHWITLCFLLLKEHLWLDKKDWTLNICSPVCFNNRNMGWSILLF